MHVLEVKKIMTSGHADLVFLPHPESKIN